MSYPLEYLQKLSRLKSPSWILGAQLPRELGRHHLYIFIFGIQRTLGILGVFVFHCGGVLVEAWGVPVLKHAWAILSHVFQHVLSAQMRPEPTDVHGGCPRIPEFVSLHGKGWRSLVPQVLHALIIWIAMLARSVHELGLVVAIILVFGILGH